MCRFRRGRAHEVESDLSRVFELFPRLKERAAQLAGTLSGGEQQMLAIGRALMARPKLIMMDEPSMGLAPLVVKDIFAIIRRLGSEGHTVLLVEQNAKAALRIANRATCWRTGASFWKRTQKTCWPTETCSAPIWDATWIRRPN